MGCIRDNCNIACICHRPELPWAVAMEEAYIRGFYFKTPHVIFVNIDDYHTWMDMYAQIIGRYPTHFQDYKVVPDKSIPKGKCAIAVRFS